MPLRTLLPSFALALLAAGCARELPTSPGTRGTLAAPEPTGALATVTFRVQVPAATPAGTPDGAAAPAASAAARVKS